MKLSQKKIDEHNNLQHSGKFHPLTCCSYHGCKRCDTNDWGTLIATEDKWVCPCEDYTQEYTTMEQSIRKVYLAIPYSGYSEKSFKLANEIAAKLLKEGCLVFSPISMSHPICKYGDMEGNWDVWEKLDLEFIRWCNEVVVINFDDDAVKNSRGVQAELDYAKKIGRPINNYY